MSRSPSPKPPVATPSSAAPAWQTIATVLIIVHLFALGVGLATNVAGGKSLLSPALYRIPLVQGYIRFLWMNVGYDFHIASPLPEDGSHRLELVSATPTSTAPELPDVLGEIPAADIQPRIRRQRYQQLAYHVAFLDELFAENADIRTALPLAIAQRWLRDLDAPHEPYVLRCLREPSGRLPKAVERAPSVKPREGGPKTEGPALYTTETITVYLVWDPETASYQGSRAEPEGQTSEVVRDAAPADDGDASAAASAIETDEPAAIDPGEAVQ
jgi:hypothetical protein